MHSATSPTTASPRARTPNSTDSGSARTLDRLERDTFDVLEAVRSEGVEGTDEFREAFVQYVATEADVEPRQVRNAMVADAADAPDFVSTTLRELSGELRERADERAAEVAADLRGSISGAREEVDAAVDAVSDLAFHLSLARFADAHDLVRPEFVAHDALAVRNARNLTLAAEDGDVQPVTYAIGDHDLADVPSGDRVAVLTGRTPAGRRRCWRRSARSRCSPRWDSRCPPSARRSDRWTPSSSTAATPRSTRASWKRR